MSDSNGRWIRVANKSAGGSRVTGTRTQDRTGWRQVAPAPLVLLQGPENYIAGRVFEAIRQQVRKRDGNAEITAFDASTYQRGELLLAASPSLFGEAKIIEATSLATMNEDFLEDALAYAASPADDVVMVLHHSGGNRGKKVLDALKAAGAGVIDCQPLKRDSEKVDFVSQEFKAAGRRILPEATRALVAAVGTDLGELAAACSQLIQDTTGEVDQETVDRYFGGRVEATGFKVADAALSGRGPAALGTLRHALATGTDPVPIVAALAMKLRQVAKVSGQRRSAGAMAQEFGMAPWQIQQAQEQARYFSADDLVRCLRLVAEADAQVKGASRDPHYAVERAVTGIALAAQR
ncbi:MULTISPECIES: DNA polymerase III subunit delta [Micrococcaceae]|uniref:DNA-directed DNA polymerase n=1 Tax=Arthrobacter rhombi TaxID=71253 RepID=A0A1R4GUY3_9MICC|nr:MULTISPECIES: DNA polymerase III subunit delta [Micrococcaceae]PCC26656.1 DNA polymerase III subunit delta [Glutamicibacter sp. BW78]SJM71988.1 DNA polymerase III delta subunit [Arthrobacter rhombi]